MGRMWKQWHILFSWAPKSLLMMTAAMKLEGNCSLEENGDKPRQHIKKQKHHFTDKGPYGQSYVFSNNHVWMWKLDYEESWVPKNWFFWMWCWRKLLRVLWTARRSNQSILKISPGCSLEGLMLKLKLQYFGHLMTHCDAEKNPAAEKDRRQKEKEAAAENDMVR